MRIYQIRLCFSVFCVCAYASARNIVVEKSSHEKIHVDISGIQTGVSANSKLFIQTLQSDLTRSGWFSLSQPNHGAVRVNAVLVEGGEYSTVKADVINAATGRKYFSQAYNDHSSKVRSLAHAFADDIVRSVKKCTPIASTKIVMIGLRNGQKDLYVCDYDGANLLRITKDGAVCFSPDWGPDARTIIYTSYYQGFPDIYKIDLSDYSRKSVSQYPGINTGATISPSGKSMALILSKDGNPDLYVKDLRSGRLSRITRTQYAAESSPSWSPDSRRIVFVSNKTRLPHLYITDLIGGNEKKVSFAGSENVGPDWGPDGRIVYSSRRDGNYHVCITNPDTGETLQLTNDHADYEDPSWAPDARHIVCTRIVGYRSELYILDTLGDPPLRLLQQDGDWYAPAWSYK